jgi:hypothetical protein
MRKQKIESPAVKMVRIDFRTQIQVPATMSDEDAIARYRKRMTPPIKPPGRKMKVKKDTEPEDAFEPLPEDTEEELEPVSLTEDDLSEDPVELE